MKKFDKLIEKLKDINFESKYEYDYDSVYDCTKFMKLIYGNNFTCRTGSKCCVCLRNAMLKLDEEYKEPIKLTKFEFDFLKNIDPKVIWIARNDRGNLEGFIDKPKKYACEWQKIINGESHFYKLSAFNHLFPFIKWEDEEATNIKKLLENCEVVDDD